MIILKFMDEHSLHLNDAENMVPTIELYHQSLQKNNYYVPSFKSGICTRDFLHRVRAQKFWVPKFEQVALRPCPIAPKKEVLVQAILDRFKEINWSVEFTGWTEAEAC